MDRGDRGTDRLFLVWRDARRRRGGRWSTLRRSLTAIGVSFWALGVWAFLIEPETLVVRHVTIESVAWRGAPLRIGLISDTHVGVPHGSHKRVRAVVAKMNAQKPDVVVLLGDYVGGHRRASSYPVAFRREVGEGISAFAGIDAPLGAAAVFGNHDWWYDGAIIERFFDAASIPLLENDARRIARPEGAFWIAGLADPVSDRTPPDYTDALAAVPEDEDVIVIAHRPDTFGELPARAAVLLAGHSHCGQVNLPVFGRLYHAGEGSARWQCGAYDEGGRKLYVTGGIGVSILPVRFNQPPEIVIVTLKTATPD